MQLHDHAWQYDNDEACHNKCNDGKFFFDHEDCRACTPQHFINKAKGIQGFLKMRKEIKE